MKCFLDQFVEQMCSSLTRTFSTLNSSLTRAYLLNESGSARRRRVLKEVISRVARNRAIRIRYEAGPGKSVQLWMLSSKVSLWSSWSNVSLSICETTDRCENVDIPILLIYANCLRWSDFTPTCPLRFSRQLGTSNSPLFLSDGRVENINIGRRRKEQRKSISLRWH